MKKTKNKNSFAVKLISMAVTSVLSIALAQDVETTVTHHFDPNTQTMISSTQEESSTNTSIDASVSGMVQEMDIDETIDDSSNNGGIATTGGGGSVLRVDNKPSTIEEKFLASLNNPINESDASRIAFQQNNLTNTDKKALEISYDVSELSNKKMMPTIGENGKVVFQYGEGQNTIICQVNQICVIELEKNEQFIEGYVSDPARWSIQDTYTGTPEDSTIMLLVRPKDFGLNSTFIITTDKRIYSLKLKSDFDYTMPLVSFAYTTSSGTNSGLSSVSTANSDKLAMEKAERERQIQQRKANERARYNAQVQANKKAEEEKRKLNTVYGSPTSHLNFNYQVVGSGYFKPVRVYSMGHQTIIEFEPSIANKELPVLYSLQNNEKAIVNYRFLDQNKYVVDSVLQNAVLVSGVGNNQSKITIKKK